MGKVDHLGETVHNNADPVRSRIEETAPGETMEDFVEGSGTGLFILDDTVGLGLAIRSNTTTGGSMLSDDEVLTLSRSSSLRILGSGAARGLGVEARVLSTELQGSANWGGSNSK
jgi:hypothetical protein